MVGNKISYRECENRTMKDFKKETKSYYIKQKQQQMLRKRKIITSSIKLRSRKVNRLGIPDMQLIF